METLEKEIEKRNDRFDAEINTFQKRFPRGIFSEKVFLEKLKPGMIFFKIDHEFGLGPLEPQKVLIEEIYTNVIGKKVYIGSDRYLPLRKQLLKKVILLFKMKPSKLGLDMGGCLIDNLFGRWDSKAVFLTKSEACVYVEEFKKQYHQNPVFKEILDFEKYLLNDFR